MSHDPELEAINELIDMAEAEFVRGPTELKTTTLLDLIVERNAIIMTNYAHDLDPEEATHLEAANTCEPLTDRTSIPRELRAYHVGPKMQQHLVARPFKYDGIPLTDKVFFNVWPPHLLPYLLSDDRLDHMVYVINLHEVTDVRVLTQYDDNTLFLFRIQTLIELYERNIGRSRISNIYDHGVQNFWIGQEVEGMTLPDLKAMIQEELSSWEERYTAPMTVETMRHCQSSGFWYMLVGGPITVVYDAFSG